MVGFGFMDNTILIRAGDAIERHFGVHFELTGLQSAAWGQVVSDFSGVLFGGVIESVSRRYVAAPGLTMSQFQLRSAQIVGTAGAALGVVAGCLLGMLNLLMLDLDAAERLKRAAELKTIFDTVMDSAVETMGCPVGTIFIVDEDNNEIWSRAMAGYEGVVRRPLDKNASIASWVAHHGIEDHCEDAPNDPRFCSDIDALTGVPAKQILTFPVFSHESPEKVIAVVQFFNKPGGFLEEDKRVMKMLCKHCGIFMAKTT